MRTLCTLGLGIVVTLAFSSSLAACDDEPNKVQKIMEAGPAAPTPTPTIAAAPPPPKAPKIAIEPGVFQIEGERVQPTDPDPVGQIATLITGKPQIEGALVEVDAKRASKPSQIVTMMNALKKAKAKGMIARTENRDKVIVPLTLTFPSTPPSDCTVVGYIAKDSKINVWTLGGGAAKTYSKGFAGPDMTLGTEGVRDSIARCDSSFLFVGADDAMIWGLVYDLATITKSGPDGGVGAPRISQYMVVPGTVVPGRKITLD